MTRDQIRLLVRDTLQKAVEPEVLKMTNHPNTPATWTKFRKYVQDKLNPMAKRYGVQECLVVCDGETNLPQLVESGEFHMEVWFKMDQGDLQPTKMKFELLPQMPEKVAVAKEVPA